MASTICYRSLQFIVSYPDNFAMVGKKIELQVDRSWRLQQRTVSIAGKTYDNKFSVTVNDLIQY
jgi:hypothetical protein